MLDLELETEVIRLMGAAYDTNNFLPLNHWEIGKENLSDSERAIQKAAENWIIDKGWARRQDERKSLLTNSGRLEVERRRQGTI